MNELIGLFCDIEFEGDSYRWPFLNGARVEAVEMPMIKLRASHYGHGNPPSGVWVNVSQIKTVKVATWQPPMKVAA